MKSNLLSLLLFLAFMGAGMAQNIADYNNYPLRFKDKDAVYLNVKTEVTVDIGSKGLKMEETKFEETYYNSFKAGAFSDNSIESSHFSKIKDIEASTLLPENNKFKEIKVKDFKTKPVLDEDIFYQDLFATSFSYPSLRQGAITRLKYTLDIVEPHFFPYEIVKRGYPIENFTFVVNTHKDVQLQTQYFFTDSSKLEYTREEKGDRIIYTWKAKNISGFTTEPGSPDHMCYLPQIVPFIKSYKLNNTDVGVFRNVDDLFHWKNTYVSNINHLHSEAMIQTVNSLVKDCTTDFQKVKAIYRWVQNNIRYIANEYALGGFIPRDPHLIFEKRYGDCKDMAVIIVEMLDIAGIKAWYTWLGTRNLPYSFKEIPTSMVTNHMIATYIDNGKYYFLDATDPYLPLELPSEGIQGKEAMIRYGNDTYEIYKIPVVPADSNSQSDNLFLSIEQGKLTGKGFVLLKGYYASNMKYKTERIQDANEKAKFMKSYLQTGNNKCVVDKYEIVPEGNSLRFNYGFSLPDHLIENGNEIYLNLNLSQPYRDFELFTNNRELDYEFDYRYLLKRNYTFTLPDGYEVTYLPKNTEYNGSDYSYSIQYEMKDKTILYHLTFTLNTILLKTTAFALWNKMLKQMRADFKEVVVLKRMK